ncbi:phosphatase PAP2 family protein [Erwinia sp. AnSW2-5]|uniref:phosphatase PAP2 family protein n=1 Tax=Erwinia sp. AnSW2-5 TaxID=3367692 RepID=UPI00385A7CAA
MLAGWGSVGVIYTFSDRWQGPGTVMHPGIVDRMIPFSADGIWLYLSFFLLIPAGYLFCRPEKLRWLTGSMILTALVCGAVYLLWPTTLVYPVDSGQGVSSYLLAQLVAADSTQNCLPSLHMALSVLAVWALYQREQRWRSGLLLLWGALIAVSILQLRRHLFIDLVSGALVALVCGWICLRATQTFPFSWRERQ